MDRGEEEICDLTNDDIPEMSERRSSKLTIDVEETRGSAAVSCSRFAGMMMSILLRTCTRKSDQ